MLRDYQRAAIDAALTFHKYKNTPAIIEIATGGGKTHVIAELARHYKEGGMRVAIVAHRRGLLEQAGDKFQVDFGYYSAGMGELDLEKDVTIAGIQSIYNKDFKPYDIIIADECQMVNNNGEGRYWEFIKKSPEAKLIGLTATPYRLSGGKLGWGEIIYTASYEMLLKQGYVAKITNKVKDSPNLENIKVVAGDYSEDDLAKFMSDPALIQKAVQNILAYGAYRYSVLIFCVNIAHCHLLFDAMKANGLQSAVITGDTPKAEHDAIIEDFKAGKLRYLINCQMFTEGFDAPCIDMIVMLRPTKSKALFEQMAGRGTRLFEGKEDCLLLDMAGNIEEHDGYGSPYREKAKREQVKKAGRLCPACESYVKPTGKDCPECGYVFEVSEPKLVSHREEADIKGSAVFEAIREFTVIGVYYRQHKSKKGSLSLRVDYAVTGYKYGVISEWLSVHHDNDWVRNKAYNFFKWRGRTLEKDTKEYEIDELLVIAETLPKPEKISVSFAKDFPEVINYTWAKKEDEEKPIELDDEIIF